eukprot:1169120-Amphidinium_carterae.1
MSNIVDIARTLSRSDVATCDEWCPELVNESSKSPLPVTSGCEASEGLFVWTGFEPQSDFDAHVSYSMRHCKSSWPQDVLSQVNHLSKCSA